MGGKEKPMIEHDVIYAQSGTTSLWRWDCDECKWSGWGCPSREFAEREHADVVGSAGTPQARRSR